MGAQESIISCCEGQHVDGMYTLEDKVSRRQSTTNLYSTRRSRSAKSNKIAEITVKPRKFTMRGQAMGDSLPFKSSRSISVRPTLEPEPEPQPTIFWNIVPTNEKSRSRGIINMSKTRVNTEGFNLQQWNTQPHGNNFVYDLISDNISGKSSDFVMSESDGDLCFWNPNLTKAQCYGEISVSDYQSDDYVQCEDQEQIFDQSSSSDSVESEEFFGDKDKMLYEGELYKFKPGISANFVSRYVQVSEHAFRYFKNKFNTGIGAKPILAIRRKYIQKCIKYKVNKASYLKKGSRQGQSGQEEQLFDNMIEIVLNDDYEKHYEYRNEERKKAEEDALEAAQLEEEKRRIASGRQTLIRFKQVKTDNMTARDKKKTDGFKFDIDYSQKRRRTVALKSENIPKELAAQSADKTKNNNKKEKNRRRVTISVNNQYAMGSEESMSICSGRDSARSDSQKKQVQKEQDSSSQGSMDREMRKLEQKQKQLQSRNSILKRPSANTATRQSNSMNSSMVGGGSTNRSANATPMLSSRRESKQVDYNSITNRRVSMMGDPTFIKQKEVKSDRKNKIIGGHGIVIRDYKKKEKDGLVADESITAKEFGQNDGGGKESMTWANRQLDWYNAERRLIFAASDQKIIAKWLKSVNNEMKQGKTKKKVFKPKKQQAQTMSQTQTNQMYDDSEIPRDSFLSVSSAQQPQKPINQDKRRSTVRFAEFNQEMEPDTLSYVDTSMTVPDGRAKTKKTTVAKKGKKKKGASKKRYGS